MEYLFFLLYFWSGLTVWIVHTERLGSRKTISFFFTVALIWWAIPFVSLLGFGKDEDDV